MRLKILCASIVTVLLPILFGSTAECGEFRSGAATVLDKHPVLVALGERVRALRARRGMTRKAVQLCSEPGHLIQNFKCYAAGMHLREAWRAAGHDREAGRADGPGHGLQRWNNDDCCCRN